MVQMEGKKKKKKIALRDQKNIREGKRGLKKGKNRGEVMRQFVKQTCLPLHLILIANVNVTRK